VYRFVIAGIAVVLVVAASSAAAELELRDGKRLKGRNIGKEAGNYTLELESGALLILPVELVARVLTDGAPSAIEKASAAGQEAGEGPAPGAPLKAGEFRSVAGFRRALSDPGWRPENSTEPAPSLDEFIPSRWYRAPIDAQSKLDSQYSVADDELRFGSSRWSRSVALPAWRPEDGFSEERP
jgi:hypothetical protein